MRAFFETLHGNVGNEAVDRVGTVHDMRWVFLDNDTSCCSAAPTTVTGILTSTTSRPRSPTSSTSSLANSKGGRGFVIRRSRTIIVKIQSYFWYVASPNLTVVETKRLERVGKALDEFLDKVG